MSKFDYPSPADDDSLDLERIEDPEDDFDPYEILGPVLPPETWGDRMHRAYRLARKRLGPRFTYRAIARRISEIEPTSDVAILRLEARDRVPGNPRARRLAVFCLALYNFDPADFGFQDVKFEPIVWYHARILWEESETATRAGWPVAPGAS